MYQELQIFEDDLNGHPLWGTEGNDLPIPSFALGDRFELPDAYWWAEAHGAGFAFRVTAIAHVFSETGRGPESNHLMKVCIEKFRPESSETNLRLEEAESALEFEEKKVKFFHHIAASAGPVGASAVLSNLIDEIVEDMENQPAHGIEEATSAWGEAARILGANGHLLAQMMRDELAEKIDTRLMKLSAAERTALWIWCGGLDAGIWDFRDDWNSSSDTFDPTDWSGTFDQVSYRAMDWLTSRLPDIYSDYFENEDTNTGSEDGEEIDEELQRTTDRAILASIADGSHAGMNQVCLADEIARVHSRYENDAEMTLACREAAHAYLLAIKSRFGALMEV